MPHWYRALRLAPLAVLALVGSACRRGSLRDDAGGATGTIGLDAAIPRDGAPAAVDGPPDVIDAPAGADTRAPTADANCGMTSVSGKRRGTEVMVILDRAVSVDPDRWNTFLAAVAAMITRNSALVSWGLYTFPTDGAVCSMASVSSTIDVTPAPNDSVHAIAHLAAAGTVTGGTPTAAAIDVAAGYMLSRTTSDAKVLMLVTDGAPTCAGRSGALTADPARAQEDAVAAIADAKAAGLPTFVLAPSTTTDAADVAALNALAVAGGYAEPGDVKFDTDATISTWFQSTDDGGTCLLVLATPGPPVPDDVTVMLNGEVVARDRSHQLGWDYPTPDATTIQFYGAWCELFQTAQSIEVDVYYGCPN